MNISDYISTTKMSSDYKPRVLLALLGSPKHTATDSELSAITGIKREVINNMVGKVLTQNGATARTADKVYTIALEVDKNSRASCISRLETFKGAK